MNHVPQIINTVHVCVAYEMKNKFLFFFFSLIVFFSSAFNLKKKKNVPIFLVNRLSVTVEPSASVWPRWVQPGRMFTTSLSPTCIRMMLSLVSNCAFVDSQDLSHFLCQISFSITETMIYLKYFLLFA